MFLLLSVLSLKFQLFRDVRALQSREGYQACLVGQGGPPRSVDLNPSTHHGSHEMAIFASSNNSYEATPDDVTTQMVEISSESQTTDSSLPPRHELQNEELYASIPDTVALANTCSIIDTPDKVLDNNYQTPPDHQAMSCPTDSLSSLNIEKSEISKSQSTRRLEAVALGPLHGESIHFVSCSKSKLCF